MRYPKKPNTMNDNIFVETLKKYPLMSVFVFPDIEYTFGNPLPILEQIAEKYAGKIVFGKMYLEKNRRIARYYGITSTPTILNFKKERLVGYFRCDFTRQELEDRLDSIIQ
jgi:thioredoxin-like negative regulator of GroEL